MSTSPLARVCAALCTLAPFFTSGCGDDDGPAAIDAGVDAGTLADAAGPIDAGVRDAGSIDAAAFDAGAVDAGGGGGIDASTHDAGPPCPASAPAMGAACSVIGQSCSYLDCGAGATGAITADCGASGWSRSAMPCTEVMCGSATCAAGEVCVERASGAFIQMCETSPCGTGPIEEGCACTLCGGLGCTVSGFTVHCVSDCMLCP